MKLHCGECWEEIGNCAPWCGEAARERDQLRCRCAAQRTDDSRVSQAHESSCPLFAIPVVYTNGID